MFQRACYFLAPMIDNSLVNFPDGVGQVKVFRNAVSAAQEQLIWEEFQQILKSDGRTYFGSATKINSKQERNRSVDLAGLKPFSSVKVAGMERVPGLVWSPTFLKVMETFGRELLGAMPDMARVVEHYLPGDEMHTEGPTTGKHFLLISLLSDTVLRFDDEATQRSGQVLLPQRSAMYCNGEVRWGWRFGEAPEPVHHFVGKNGLKKKVETDLRMSIQTWKYDEKLLDRKKLQETLQKNENPEKPEIRIGVGKGELGGDLVKSFRSQKELSSSAQSLKNDFKSFTAVIADANERVKQGKEVTEDWFRSQLPRSETADEFGFDPKDVQGTWKKIEQSAREHRRKLAKMNYDGNSPLRDEAAPKPYKELLSDVKNLMTPEEMNDRLKKLHQKPYFFLYFFFQL